MSQPERLDIQLRRKRLRRESIRIGVPVLAAMGCLALYALWRVEGWHWWYVPGTLAAFGAALWVSRLETDVTEEATRWFWRPPK